MTRPLVLLAATVLLSSPTRLAAVPISPREHALVLLIADAQGVPRSVANWLQIEESGDRHTGQWGDTAAIGPKGADGSRCRGLYQINPRWEAELVARHYPHAARYFDVFNPLDNAVVALGYLAALHRRFGSWERALWFYNSGRVVGVPEGTRNYARRIINAR